MARVLAGFIDSRKACNYILRRQYPATAHWITSEALAERRRLPKSTFESLFLWYSGPIKTAKFISNFKCYTSCDDYEGANHPLKATRGCSMYMSVRSFGVMAAMSVMFFRDPSFS